MKSNKNDVADAEAICEAVSRPTMRFVPIKSIEQQAILSVHRVRQGLVRALANKNARTVWALLAHGREFRPGLCVNGSDGLGEDEDSTTGTTTKEITPPIAQAICS